MAPEDHKTKTAEAVVTDAASLETVVAALAQCPAKHVLLTSPPGGALTLGPLFFRKLMDLAAARFPDKTLRGRLDCADKPGLVLAAFRHGLDAAVETDDERYRRLQEIAHASGQQVVRNQRRRGG
ncbi:MAG: hypothetical protein OXF26_06715 [Alphaproteobacteria bacterium]|nr:hypothetical protein [Alphaproteobacteria bacterium]MCY4230565.1 hypothetical protein [Alphaproteobacteria bacterium]MCY4319964.1 hypothetical protein [Alphaproteobacteria bacterium]